jgi:chromosome partitioning protein
MKTITITNEKGGVAKTTTSIQLASGLAMKGKKVLAIDLDSQKNLSNTFGLKPSMKVNTIQNLIEGEDIRKCIFKARDNLFVIFGDSRTRLDFSIKTKEDYLLLKQKLEEVKDLFDFVVIDTPPKTERFNILAMTTSDEIIIPMEADTYSMQGLATTLEIVQKVKSETNPNLSIKGILLTRFKARTLFSRMTRGDLQKIANQMKFPVFETTIRESIEIKKSQGQLQSIFEYNPKSKVAHDYESFIQEYLTGKPIQPEDNEEE